MRFKVKELLIGLGLALLLVIAGCAPAPAAEPSAATPSPSTPLDISTTPSAQPTPSPPAKELPARPSPSPEQGQQPPVDVEKPSLHPVELARSDLARRLHIDFTSIEVTEVGLRDLSPEDLDCRGVYSLADAPWTERRQVQWITLSARNKEYQYVSFDGQLFYCED